MSTITTIRLSRTLAIEISASPITKTVCLRICDEQSHDDAVVYLYPERVGELIRSLTDACALIEAQL